MYTKLPNGQIVYAEDISCVVDSVNGKGGIYIGNLQASQNPKTLKKHGIKAVLTAAKSVMLDHPKSEVPYYLHVPGEDKDGFDLSRFFPQSVNFIRDSLEKTNILVHCLAGVSRSVSLVVAYLIKCKGMTYDTAYNMLKARRKIIHPNDGFISQLKRYEREVLQNTSSEKQYLYRGYSASPTKKRQEYNFFESHEEDYYKKRQYNNYSPEKKVNYQYNYQQTSSPTKKRKVDFSDSPSKRYGVQPESRLKKLSSFDQNKVDYENYGYNPEKSRVQDYLPRGKTYSDYKVDENRNVDYGKSRVKADFNNINEELDQKIARIRQKYAEYTNSQARSSPRRHREPKYNNFFDENQLNGSLALKKITSDYTVEKEPVYGMVKRNYQRPSGLGIRKLNSMKDY